MVKRVLRTLGGCFLALSLFAGPSLSSVAAEEETLNNADVMPKYVSDKYVDLEASDADGLLMTPDWLKTAIMVQVRIENATPEGTLEAAVSMLDHYQEMGVNCLWITPVFHKESNNGYTNFGVHTIDPGLTGTTDYEEGWEIFGWFVQQAHKRDIRILLDFITWGVSSQAPILQERPELFSDTELWGGVGYNWEDPVFQEWYIEQALKIIEVTNIDGIRCDVEPNYTGYEMYRQIRQQALERGHKIVLMGEVENERMGVYDLEQNGVISYNDGWDIAKQYADPRDYYLEEFNIVDSVKTGEGIGSKLSQALEEGGAYRFYTNCLSNHDYGWTVMRNDLIRVGYQAIFAPFIPLWFMGEEVGSVVNNQTLYFAGTLDLTLLEDPENKEFYETLKKYIHIRRTYPDIFENYPLDHRDSNICKVEVGGIENLQAYARYDENGNAILIVPNSNLQNTEGDMTVIVPFAEMGMFNYESYTVTDLMSDTKLVSGDKETAGVFDVQVPHGEIGVYLVEASGRIDVPTTPAEPEDPEPAAPAESSEPDAADPQQPEEPVESETSDSSEEPVSSEPEDTQPSQEATSAGEVSEQPAGPAEPRNNGFWIALVVMGVLVVAGAAGLVVFILKKPKAS